MNWLRRLISNWRRDRALQRWRRDLAWAPVVTPLLISCREMDKLPDCEGVWAVFRDDFGRTWPRALDVKTLTASNEQA